MLLPSSPKHLSNAKKVDALIGPTGLQCAPNSLRVHLVVLCVRERFARGVGKYDGRPRPKRFLWRGASFLVRHFDDFKFRRSTTCHFPRVQREKNCAMPPRIRHLPNHQHDPV